MKGLRPNQATRECAIARSRQLAAFTLIELLVVMAIIAIIASIGLPAIKGLGKGTGMRGAEQQFIQDLGMARLSAINGRTTVYMVFVPPGMTAHYTALDAVPDPASRDRWKRQFTNLISGQYTAYALLTKRTVGDQPGRENPRYISEWKRLPQGILIATNKFQFTDRLQPVFDPAIMNYPIEYRLPFVWSSTNLFPFPASRSPAFQLPSIAFNSQGQLVSGRDELIPLTEGSIFFQKNNVDQYVLNAPPDVLIKPPDNYTNHFIRVNWLTGRAALDERTRPKFQ